MEELCHTKERFVLNHIELPTTSTMSKQAIQSSDEKVWSDVESNKAIVSDDDALMNATGKVGELKRYAFMSSLQEHC